MFVRTNNSLLKKISCAFRSLQKKYTKCTYRCNYHPNPVQIYNLKDEQIT